jgi:hypothetical protein
MPIVAHSRRFAVKEPELGCAKRGQHARRDCGDESRDVQQKVAMRDSIYHDNVHAMHVSHRHHTSNQHGLHLGEGSFLEIETCFSKPTHGTLTQP